MHAQEATANLQQVQPALRVRAFSVLLLCYWVYLYARVLLPLPEESSVSYALTVIPIAGAAACGVFLAALRGNRALMDGPAVMLLAFVILATLASVARGDWASIRSAGLLALTLTWLSTTRADVSVTILNRFFLASIVAGAAWYLLGLSEYGLLPGQYTEGADRGIEWRVSLFPFVAESGFFALVVFLANQALSRGWKRVFYCGFALYFLVFSGMRSALLALALCETYILFARARRKRPALRLTLLVTLLVVFVALIALASVAVLLPAFGDGTLTNYLFRTETVGDSDVAISQTVYRAWLWLQHLGMFFSAPLAGIGTFDFATAASEMMFEDQGEKGSESFLTGWLARLGLCFLPMIVFLGMLGKRAAHSDGVLAGAIFLVLGVAALAYGSFLVPYNFMFLILFRLLLQERQAK